LALARQTSTQGALFFTNTGPNRPKGTHRICANDAFGGGGSTDHIFGPKEKEDAAPSATYQAQKKQNKKETDE